MDRYDLLIRNATIVDGTRAPRFQGDIGVAAKKISLVGKSKGRGKVEIDASGKIVSSGLIDMHVHLREPGREEDETIETGTAAAVSGGFTSIACVRAARHAEARHPAARPDG